MSTPDVKSLHSIGTVRDLYALLQAIDEVVPTDTVLYVEGTSIAPEIKSFFAAHSIAGSMQLPLATMFPRPETFHVALDPGVLTALRTLADAHAEPEILDHLAVYRGDSVLLWAPDAGSSEVLVSQKYAPAIMARLKSLSEPLQN